MPWKLSLPVALTSIKIPPWTWRIMHTFFEYVWLSPVRGAEVCFYIRRPSALWNYRLKCCLYTLDRCDLGHAIWFLYISQFDAESPPEAPVHTFVFCSFSWEADVLCVKIIVTTGQASKSFQRWLDKEQSDCRSSARLLRQCPGRYDHRGPAVGRHSIHSDSKVWGSQHYLPFPPTTTTKDTKELMSAPFLVPQERKWDSNE